MRLSILLLLALLAWPATRAAHAAQWPEVRLPPGAQGFSMDGTIFANGMPMQVQGFLSKQPATQVIAWFRSSLGMPLVENHVGISTVLGRAQGSHYLTVQVEPAGNGSRGLIAQSNLPALFTGREEESSLQSRWLSRLPSGMRLHSLTRGHDGKRHYQYLVLGSPHASSLSRDAISSLMQQDGYALEREVQSVAPSSRTLYFRGAAQEATAIILSNPDGSSAIVLNTIVTIGGGQ
jgi:hypothetical protein